MPYSIQKRGSKFALVRRNGTVKSRHSTKGKAKAAARIIHSADRRKKK